MQTTPSYVTKVDRMALNLPKTHYFDAIAIAAQGKPVSFKQTQVLFKRRVASGDYQQRKGKRSEKAMPPAKILGFRKFDRVSYLGQKAFIKGHMSTGYAILMDIRGEVINFGHIPKMRAMKRLTARRSTLLAPEPMQPQSIGAFSPDGRNSSPT